MSDHGMRQAQQPTQPRPQGGRGRGGFGGPMMGRPVEKPKNFKKSFKRFLGWLQPVKVMIIIVIVLAIVSTVFSIVSPKILGKATTKMMEGIIAKMMHKPGAGIDFPGIARILITVLCLYVVSALFSYGQALIMVRVVQKIGYDLRNSVYAKLQRLPLKYFDGRTHGEILSRMTNDIDNINGTLQQSMTQVINSLFTIIGAIIMMLSINGVLTLICIATLPLVFIGTAVIAKRSQKNFAAQQKELGELNGHVEEMYTGHKIVKAFGHEKKAIDKFDKINNRLFSAAWRAQFVSGIIMPLMNFINNIGYVFICVVGSIYVTKRIITIGDVQAFIQYARQFSQPIVQTANIANILQSTIASAERIFEILDEPEETPDKADATTLSEPKGEVRFDGVKFGYSDEAILMDNMNIEVKAGQTIAIVGPTGAGKTTLVNLLMRFYEIKEGRISVDGIDIKDFKRGDLRCMFGMVLQDTWLFNGTIRDNIAYSRDDATEEGVIEAAKAAHADHFIRALPDGYDTKLNEDASNISQGEKQLLTIARAILADPAILILDEATSSVDTRTEVYIRKAMETLMKNRTCFVIAHRLSTIRDAGLILVMNNGSIIEKGTHRELLDRKGFYADLYASQFTGAYIAENEA